MNTHVNGHFAPMTLAELRQSLLAVYVGNPHFSDAEQLEATHDAHACEDWHYLAAWLKGARLEDAKRRREAHLLALNTKPLALAVCHDEQAQLAELDELVKCRALRPYQKSTALLLISDPIFDAHSRVRMLGDAYFALLHNVGYQEVPNRYRGLLSN